VFSYGLLGVVAGGFQLRRVAERCFETARSLRNDASDVTAFASALYMEALYRTALGDWEASRRLAVESLELLNGIGNQQDAEIARTILANSCYYQGLFAEAEAGSRAVLQSAEHRANAEHLAWGLFLTGRSLVALGRLREAVDYLRRGHARIVDVGDLSSMIMCEGSLARALLYGGDTDQAAALAEVLWRRLRALRAPIPGPQCLDAYGALPEVYLALWESRRDAAATFGEGARWACRELRRFARMVPMAQPAALRFTALEHWLEGRSARAEAFWGRSLAAARHYRMPYDEARVHHDMARCGAEERTSHRSGARELYERLGCAHHLAEVARL
jgi:tetratricopeptide (TPR) repeat protein